MATVGKVIKCKGMIFSLVCSTFVLHPLENNEKDPIFDFFSIKFVFFGFKKL